MSAPVRRRVVRPETLSSSPFAVQPTLTRPAAFQCCHHQHPRSPQLVQRRTFLGGLFGGGRKGDSSKKNKAGGSLQDRLTNPLLAEYLNRPAAKPQMPPTTPGELSSESVFADEQAAVQRQTTDGEQDGKEDEVPPHMRSGVKDIANVLDPNPVARIKWQRKKVEQMIRRGERLTPAQFIKRTEREIDVKSPNFKTSVKKLGPLARQIRGKTVEDALVQMRFSSKKAARDVREHLEYARDKAIVSRGMGLGGIKQEGEAEPNPLQSFDIRQKDGKRRTIGDPTTMYVDQAWVGRGPYGKLPEYRARGQMNILRTPWTHLVVRLKEESTLVREHKEREVKRAKKRFDKPWMHLPDRPVHGQNPYYTW